MPGPPPDHYAALQVSRTATPGEIRSAYRKLAREHHPDANPSPEAELRMRQINQAWETLKDPAQRSLYDRTLPGAARPVARPMRATRPPGPAARPAPSPSPRWGPPEDAPRAESRAGVEYTGDPAVNWYREIGVRADASRQEILKALSRMAASLNGADITATEFTRRRTAMRDAWAVLGDQYMRAAYDRARRAATPASPDREGGGPNPKSNVQNSKSSPSPGYRLGPVSINGHIIDKGTSLPGADLRGASLRGLDLAGIDLRDARLQGADLESCALRKAQLQGADLSGASLRFADLSNADATGATLRQADLTGAVLRAANFFRANLSGAGLANAAGPGINLDYADLARADFTGAAITPQFIERGRLSATIMPDGSTSS